jgi:HK97 family phage portal protein
MNIFGRKSAGRASARPAPIGVQLGRALSSAYPALGEWPRSYEAQVREGYLSNVIAQRAVRMVAEGVASVPFSGSDPAAVALVTTNSAGQSLLETVAIHLLLHGNGYVQLLSGDDGVPCELYALRPERISVEADARGWPSGFLYKAGSAATRLSPDQLIHIRTHHPLDDHYGLGCLGAASGPIAIHNAATKWNKALLDNAARPSGALVYEPGEAGTTLSPEQFDRLKAEMEASFSGAPNAGRPMLLEGGLRWQSMSLSPTDMDFIALKSGAARDIALAFGVPPMLLGLPGDATYANYREANKALWRSGVLPLAGKMLAALAQGLRPWFPGLAFAVDYDAIGALAEDRERLWVQLSAADFLTLDEKRVLAGFAALGGEEEDEGPEGEAEVDAEPVGGASETEESTEVKFNPHHDPNNGQFTFAPGGGSSSAAATNGAPAGRRSGESDRSSSRPTKLMLNTSDDNKIGNRTVHEASNILTNETNGLAGGPPGELERAKLAVAHTIHNGLLHSKPPQVAPHVLSKEAESSIGRIDDQQIARKVFVAKMIGRPDPVNGAIFYGTSPSLITSRKIGSGRQDVLQRFGPFDHGAGPKQYIYIYGKPYIPPKK